MLLAPMAKAGADPLGSMGNDAPLAPMRCGAERVCVFSGSSLAWPWLLRCTATMLQVLLVRVARIAGCLPA